MRLSLRCDVYFLSVMNLTGGNDSLLGEIMRTCDGKQQCTIQSSAALQNETLSFYCSGQYVVMQCLTFHYAFIACIDKGLNNTAMANADTCKCKLVILHWKLCFQRALNINFYYLNTRCLEK